MKKTVIGGLLCVLILGWAGPLKASPPQQDGCRPIDFGETVTGEITDDTAQVCFTIEPALTQRFQIEMRAVEGDLDTALQLLTSANLLMDSNYNAHDGTTDSLIENYTAMMPGKMIVIATRSGGASGTTTGTFELRASLYTDAIQPATAPAQSASVGEEVSGAATTDDPRVFYEYVLDEPVLLMLYVQPASEWRPYLALHRVGGEFSTVVDEANAVQPGSKAVLGPILVQPGTVRVEVAPTEDSDPGAFTLLVAEPAPIASGSTLAYGDWVAGELGAAPDTQTFTFEGTQGDAVMVAMRPPEGFGEQIRASIEISLDDGEPLATSQNAYEPEIALLLLQADGTYQITVNSFAGAGPFALHLERRLAGGKPYEIPVSDIGPGDRVTGDIGLLAYAQAYHFEAEAGSEVSMFMKAIDGDLDPYLVLNHVLPDGRKKIAQNDNRSAFGTNAGITNLYITEGGTYEIVATRRYLENGGTTGSFELNLTVLSPDEVPERPPLRPVPVAGEHGKWTIMYYIGADNDVEEDEWMNFNELELVGSTEDVRFVVQMDRSAGYSTAGEDWYGARRYAVGQDYNRFAISSPVVEDLGVVDSGSPDTLTDFLLWAVENYPADHYMLIIADHGGGWSGAVIDEDTGSFISVEGIRSALEAAGEQTDAGRIEVLAFDACMMGAIEVLEGLWNEVDVMTASAEPTAVSDFNHEVLAEAFIANPDATPQEMGFIYNQAYVRFAEEEDQGGRLIATYDLSKVPAIMATLEDFTTLLEENPELWLVLDEAYMQSMAYVGNRYVDLGHLAENFALLSDDEQAVTAAEALVQAIDEAILLYNASPEKAMASGLSIRLPLYEKIGPNYGTRLVNPFWVRWADLVNAMND